MVGGLRNPLIQGAMYVAVMQLSKVLEMIPRKIVLVAISRWHTGKVHIWMPPQLHRGTGIQ